jgi:hypothetical protein
MAAALTDIGTVLMIPGMSKYSSTGQVGFINQLIGAATQAIQSYTKRDLVYTSYTEYHSGNDWPDLVLNQRPIAGPTVANGNTCDVTGVWVDPNGYAGQGQPVNNVGPFGPQTLLALGTNYFLDLDATIGGILSSERGILKMISGGVGWPWYGFYPVGAGWGKLSGSKLPGWPRGNGNIKVQYSAGFQTIPADLSQACAMMVVYLTRTMPSGSPLTSESLGSYSYSVAAQSVAGTIPELGSTGMTLRSYRERPI